MYVYIYIYTSHNVYVVYACNIYIYICIYIYMSVLEYINIDRKDLFCYSVMILLPIVFDIKPSAFKYFKPDSHSIKSQRLQM